MFFGLLRRSNALKPAGVAFDSMRHLARRDVIFSQQGALVTIKWSKTDQFSSRPRVLPFPRIKGHPLCPTQALFNFISRSQGAPPDGPLFVTGRGGQAAPLSPTAFSSTFVKALSRAGMSTVGISSHSCRRGGAVFLWNSAGMDEGRIRALGDWASSAYTAYVISDKSGLSETMQAMATALPTRPSLPAH